MKLTPPSHQLPAVGCAALLSLLLGAAACGEEAPLPPIQNPNGTAGTSVLPAGGTGGSTGGTGAAPAGGTGMTPTGGTSAASGSAGTGPVGGAPTGGSGGAAGSATGGMSGSATGGGGTGGGAPVDLKETVAGTLNGAMYLGTCGNNSNQTVCQTGGGMACPAKNQADPPLGGKLTTDRTITLGGDPTKTYTITLHVQGEVEAKGYSNGMDQNNSAAHPKMDGFYVGGTPQSGDDYNIYMARVSSPKQDYFLNSIKPPGVTDHTTYLIDYTAKIKANGGATIRMTAADTNCSMIKNCGPTPNGTTLCAQPLTMQNVNPVAVSKNPSFDFNTAYNGQWIVVVVTDVTQD